MERGNGRSFLNLPSIGRHHSVSKLKKNNNVVMPESIGEQPVHKDAAVFSEVINIACGSARNLVIRVKRCAEYSGTMQ